MSRVSYTDHYNLHVFLRTKKIQIKKIAPTPLHFIPNKRSYWGWGKRLQVFLIKNKHCSASSWRQIHPPTPVCTPSWQMPQYCYSRNVWQMQDCRRRENVLAVLRAWSFESVQGRVDKVLGQTSVLLIRWKWLSLIHIWRCRRWP